MGDEPDTALSVEKDSKRATEEVTVSQLPDQQVVSSDANPQTWPTRRKWAITMMLSGFSVLPPLSTTIIAPSQFAIGRELNIQDAATVETCMSIFNLGIGIGPLIMSPLSEMYGRRPVLLLGTVFFLAWNTASGFIKTESQLVVCRLFTGIGSAAALSVMGAVMGDIWPPERRARAIAIATFLPLLGPAIGPIVGGYITQYLSWRWILWVLSIAIGVLLGISFVFLRETYAPLIQQRLKPASEKPAEEKGKKYKELSKKIGKNLLRPFILLGTKPIVQIACIFSAVIYGTMFLNLYSFPLLWTNIYHQETGQGSLNYISTGVGYTIGSQVGGPLNDFIYKRLKKRNGNVGHPHFRLPLVVPASIFVAGGLIMLGWTGQERVFWLVPNVGNAIFQIGNIVASQVITVYLIDAFALHAASALSTNNLVRSVASFLFPLFAPALYDRLGWGWASTVLALITATFMLLMSAILWVVSSAAEPKEEIKA